MAFFSTGGQETPESIAQKRRMAAALMRQALSGHPIGWQGLGSLASALAARRLNSKADKAQSAGDKAVEEFWTSLGGAPGAAPEMASGPAATPIQAMPMAAPSATPPATPPASSPSMTFSPEEIDRVVSAESAGNPNAVSPKGAGGLMQIMPATWQRPGLGMEPGAPGMRMDSEANRAFGTEYLNRLLERYGGDKRKALAAYNWGMGNVDASGLEGAPQETRDYLEKTMPARSDYIREMRDEAKGISDAGSALTVPERVAQPQGGAAGMVTPSGSGGAVGAPPQNGGDMSVQQLYAAASNPFIMQNPGAAMVVQAMLKKKLGAEQGMTPYQQAALRERALDRDARIAAARAGRPVTNVTVGGEQNQFGKVEPGYRRMFEKDAQGKVTSVRDVPIKGSKPYMELRSSAVKAGGALRKAERQFDLVDTTIDEAIAAIKDSNVPLTGIFSLANSVPGTPQYDLYQKLQTIRANRGFAELQAMRDASPTGGALGQVSEMENRLLQAVNGSVEQGQTAAQLIQSLERIKALQNTLRSQNRDVFAAEFGDVGYKLPAGSAGADANDGQAPDGVPDGVPPEAWRHMKPEERALWSN